MRLHTGLILVLAGATLSTAFARDANMDAMVKMAKQYDAALRAKDLAWFEKVFASEYVNVNLKGKKSTRAETMAEMKGVLQMATVKQVASKVLKASSKGGDVI